MFVMNNKPASKHSILVSRSARAYHPSIILDLFYYDLFSLAFRDIKFALKTALVRRERAAEVK